MWLICTLNHWNADTQSKLSVTILCYISESRHGVTDSEMYDLLSYDDIVMQSAYRNTSPNVKYLPNYIWQITKHILKFLLIQVECKGFVLTRWRYKSVVQIIRTRYFTMHAGVVTENMFNYFQEQCGNKDTKEDVHKTHEQKCKSPDKNSTLAIRRHTQLEEDLRVSLHLGAH